MAITGKKILITGGLGFIGINAVRYFLKANTICVIDDGSRIGCDMHKQYLSSVGVQLAQIDISHMSPLREIYHKFQPDIVLHLAAQVAVTLSVVNPVRDFLSNVQGTFNLLELARHSSKKPIFLYASTNKVYGQHEDNVILKDGCYHMTDREGFDEKVLLSFLSPYGCSKGAADQYVLDYARTYGLKTVVLRQSCIYGPDQFGFEDQGWVAWFIIAALLEKPLTVYGDGCQVRDLLYIDDLLDVYKCAIERIDQAQGEAFNIGGGPSNVLSINGLIRMIEQKTGKPLPVQYADWRLGDQKVYICDIRKAEKFLGWSPKMSVNHGIQRLMQWAQSEKKTISQIFESGQHIGKKYDVSIVLPAKNEEESLPAVLDELETVVKSSPSKIEVIVVNDRSTDRTAAIARQYDFVKVVDNQYHSGKGGALRYGFESARGEYFTMMDADFSHNPEDLSYMIEKVRHHNGLVIASRVTGGSEEYTHLRAFGNIVLTFLFGFVHGRYLSDSLNGFKIFHRDVFQKFIYTSDNFEIEIELLVNTLRLGRPITEVASRERMRSGGKMKSSVIKHGTLFMLRILYEKFRKGSFK